MEALEINLSNTSEIDALLSVLDGSGLRKVRLLFYGYVLWRGIWRSQTSLIVPLPSIARRLSHESTTTALSLAPHSSSG